MLKNAPLSPQPLTRADLQNLAAQHQLELLGLVALPSSEPSYAAFSQWLAEGKHAGMSYLEQHQHCRREPGQLFPLAKTAIILGFSYYQGDTLNSIRTASNTQPAQAQIAQYARLKDYHKHFRQSCERFWQELQHLAGGGSARICVDTAPLLERALAARSAKGFIGKNTLYIHPQKGSFFLLAEVLTSLELPLDQPPPPEPSKRHPERGGCGSCKRCQVHCPTGALNADYSIDARKCLAYYTIEHRGVIPLPYWRALRLYIFGCDLCQLACPYNRHATVRAFAAHERAALPEDLFAIATMSQTQYEAWFGGTPLTRAKISGLKRNALIALVVSQDPRLEEALARLREEALPLVLATIAQIPAFNSEYL